MAEQFVPWSAFSCSWHGRSMDWFCPKIFHQLDQVGGYVGAYGSSTTRVVGTSNFEFAEVTKSLEEYPDRIATSQNLLSYWDSARPSCTGVFEYDAF